MNHEFLIRHEIEKIAKSPVAKGFYSTFIQKRTQAPLEEVESVCKRMVKEGLLFIQYEHLCPDCFIILDTQTDPKAFNPEYTCQCGLETEVDSSLIKIRYLITHTPLTV